MAGLFGGLLDRQPKSAAEKLKGEPTPGGLGGTLSTADVLKIRPRFNQYRENGGDMTWEMYAKFYAKNGTPPD